MDKIGIVTITYNSEKVLVPFIDCIIKQTYSNFNLYVVDNNSSDNTYDLLSEIKDDRVVLIKNQKNLGVAKGNNQGILKSIDDNCDQILLINNDVEFESKLLEKLILAQEKSNSSLVSPKINYFSSKNKIWYAGSWFDKKRGFLPIHRGMGEIDCRQYDKVEQVEYSPTCCCLITKKVFEDVGLMDEDYFVYFDDTDFSYRVLNDGRHKMIYYPFVKFYHKVGSLTNSFDKKQYRGDFFIKQNISNHIFFLKKIGSLFAYTYIFWMFFRNNIRFFVNPRFKKNLSTLLLINKSYFVGLFKKKK
tara:strand:- start:1395 stop:2303 length:909 start_codon:yes stop_codon:yes gene_type:complete